MLQKILSVFLILGLVLSFAGCQSNRPSETESTESTEDVGEIASTEEIFSAEETEEEPAPIVLLLPGSVLSAQDMDIMDALNEFIQQQGLLGAELTEDGSISVTLEVSRQAAILERISGEIEAAIAVYVQGEATPYIQQILHSDDYTAFTLQVDGSDYKASFDFASDALSEKALEYQLYAGKPYTVAVTVQDGVTGNVLRSFSVPAQ